MNHELFAAHARARETFLKFSTVLGVGVGPKVDGGKVTARESIIVLVFEKLPAKDVPEGELIPKRFGGFPTDVREPVLQVTPNGRSESLADICRTDTQWIDWTKIHQLALAQHPERPPKRPPTKRAKPDQPDK